MLGVLKITPKVYWFTKRTHRIQHIVVLRHKIKSSAKEKDAWGNVQRK